MSPVKLNFNFNGLVFINVCMKFSDTEIFNKLHDKDFSPKLTVCIPVVVTDL